MIHRIILRICLKRVKSRPCCERHKYLRLFLKIFLAIDDGDPQTRDDGNSGGGGVAAAVGATVVVIVVIVGLVIALLWFRRRYRALSEHY